MKISLYIGYHSKVDMIDDDIFKYIYCGAAINGEENYIPGTLRDDTGDNISYLNKKLCECTALYWIWKNDKDSDYVGFMHYRRHLNFSNNTYSENKYGVKEYNNISNTYINDFGLEKQTIARYTLGKDIILPKKYDCRKNNYTSNYDLYQKTKSHHIENLNTLMELIRDEYKEYLLSAQNHLKDNFAYYTNIFLMKREIFNEYCNFLFPILFKLNEKIDCTDYNQQEQRAVAFLSERIFDIYMRSLADSSELSLAECQRSFITYPYTQVEVENTGAVPIVMACDNNFIKFASACIYSIIENSNRDKNYSIYILYSNISKENMIKIKKLSNNYKNITIEFIDCTHAFNKIKLPVHMHFTRETYYRFIIPSVFKNFKKVIYIDADTIVLEDIAKLYEIDIDGFAVAGIKDYIFEGMCIKKIPSCKETGSLPADEYAKRYLAINPEKYIQAGVLIFNIEYILEKNLDDKLFSHFDKPYWFVDQDIINIVFEDQKYFLDIRWNVAHGNDVLDTFYKELPVRLSEEYFKARETPFILHFAGDKKPWFYPHVSFADEFWKYARNTPFYEEILLAMDMHRIHQHPSFKQRLKDKLFPPDTTRHKVAKKIYRKIKSLSA